MDSSFPCPKATRRPTGRWPQWLRPSSWSKVTDFKGAVKAEPGENIVFSWIVWPSKAARDEGNRKVMADPRLQSYTDMPFSGERLIFGGFEILLDTGGK